MHHRIRYLFAAACVPAGVLAAAMACATPARAQAARNVTGADPAQFARWLCLGKYDATPNRLAPERVRAGQGALRLFFALEGGQLTARIERAAGTQPWLDPASAKSFETLGRAANLFVVHERMVFTSPGGAAYELRIRGGKRLEGTMTPRDIPQFRDAEFATVRLDCEDRPAL
ncbi:MAG: hypothetical protein IT562_25600 [Alphaproteobacteria bacterium]|nr:hypothetical protein [Alphaproteobacteria bacterium]